MEPCGHDHFRRRAQASIQDSQDLWKWDKGPKSLPFRGPDPSWPPGFSPTQSQPEDELSKPWSQRQRKEPSVLSQKPWLPHTVSLAHSSMSAGQWRLGWRACSHTLSLFVENTYLFGLLAPRSVKSNF